MLISDKDIKDVLVEARKIIASKENWCQLTYARDADGKACDTKGKLAFSFSLDGSVLRAIENLGFKKFGMRIEIFDLLEESINGDSIIVEPPSRWNDDPDRKHHDVLQLLDRTIEGLA